MKTKIQELSFVFLLTLGILVPLLMGKDDPAPQRHHQLVARVVQ